MSHPIAVQFNGIILHAEHNGADHILTRYRAGDLTLIPFENGDTTSIIHTDSEAQACGLTVDEATGLVVADVPTSSGLVTRLSREFGNPGSWETIGS